jgi:hypothetical protein
MNELEPERDPRVRADGSPHDCFVCGHRVPYNRATNDPHFVRGPLDIFLAAHGACLNGRKEFDIATRFQQALWAALVGKKERT